MRHHTWSNKRPPRGNGITPVDKIRKTLRKEGVIVAATPADVPARRPTVGNTATVRHAEPQLELDAEAIEEVATVVVDPVPAAPNELGTIVRIHGVHRDVEEFILELADKVGKLELDLAKLRSQVRNHTHGDAPAKKPKEPTMADRVLEWMNAHPGLKINPTSVAENIDVDDNARVADVLSTLAKAGKIDVHDRGKGKHVIYSGKLPAE